MSLIVRSGHVLRRVQACTRQVVRWASVGASAETGTPAPELNHYGRHVQASGRRFAVTAGERNWRVSQ